MTPLRRTLIFAGTVLWCSVRAGLAQAPGEDACRVFGRVLHYRPISFQETRWGPLPPGLWIIPDTGDLNGDGYDDLLALEPAKNQLWVGRSDGAGAFTFEQWLPSQPLPFDRNGMRIADLDSDGVDDLMVYIPKAGWFTLRSDAAGRFEAAPVSIFPEAFAPYRWMLASFNCDGMPDIIAFETPTRAFFVPRWPKAFGKPAALTMPEHAHFPMPLRGVECARVLTQAPQRQWLTWSMRYNRHWGDLSHHERWRPPVVGDFNGDGLDDLLTAAERTPELWWAVESEQEDGIERGAGSPFRETPETSALRVGDFNGDGFDDILTWKPDRALRVALAQSGVPQEGVPISAAALGTAVTDAEGRFALHCGGQKEKVTITADDTTRGYLQKSRTVYRHHTRFPANFIIQPPPRPGQPVAFGPEPPGPYVCTGYALGHYLKWRAQERCPAHYAYFSVDDPSAAPKNAADVPAAGMCCRVPSDDILSGEHIWAESRCPPGHVATGSMDVHCMSCSVRPLRCTKINTDRYQLGDAVGAAYWGIGNASAREHKQLTLSQIAPALRAGIGRGGYRGQDADGCVPEHQGALLVEKRGGGCAGMLFAPLQYRGLPGDPPRGTPVKMLPDCSPDNPFDPTTGCRETDAPDTGALKAPLPDGRLP